MEDLQCTAQGGALEVTVTARVEGTILERCTTACVESIALGEPLTPADPEISLRVYYAQAGEQLFEIARRFSVSPGQMLAANDLPEGTETLQRLADCWYPVGNICQTTRVLSVKTAQSPI